MGDPAPVSFHGFVLRILYYLFSPLRSSSFDILRKCLQVSLGFLLKYSCPLPRFLQDMPWKSFISNDINVQISIEIKKSYFPRKLQLITIFQFPPFPIFYPASSILYPLCGIKKNNRRKTNQYGEKAKLSIT